MEFTSCVDLLVEILLGFEVNGRESWLITMVNQHMIIVQGNFQLPS